MKGVVVNATLRLLYPQERDPFYVKIDFCIDSRHGAWQYQSLGQVQCYKNRRGAGGGGKRKEDWKERKNQIVLWRSEAGEKGGTYLQNVTFVKADEWSGKWREVKIGLVRARPLHVRILDSVEERIKTDGSQRRSTHTHTHTHTHKLQCQHSFVYSPFSATSHTVCFPRFLSISPSPKALAPHIDLEPICSRDL
jgi:hypothetical protein